MTAPARKITPCQKTTRRTSRIFTEGDLMYERLVGKAAPVHDEKYRKLRRALLLYFVPLMIEQETKLEKG